MKFLIIAAMMTSTVFAQSTYETNCFAKTDHQYQGESQECRFGLRIKAKVSMQQGQAGLTTYGVPNQGQNYIVLNHISSSMVYDESSCVDVVSRHQLQQIHNENLSLTFFNLEQMDRFISDRYCNRAETSGLKAILNH